MGAVEAGIGEIARSRVRDALLHLTRGEQQELHIETIANEAAVDPALVADVLDELRTEGPFEVSPVEGSEDVWRVA